MRLLFFLSFFFKKAYDYLIRKEVNERKAFADVDQVEILQPVHGEVLLVRVIAQGIWWGSEQDFSLVLSGPIEEYVDLHEPSNIPSVELISVPSSSSCNTSPTFTFALQVTPNMSEVYTDEASTICRVRKVGEQNIPWQACESKFTVGL